MQGPVENVLSRGQAEGGPRAGLYGFVPGFELRTVRPVAQSLHRGPHRDVNGRLSNLASFLSAKLLLDMKFKFESWVGIAESV